MYRYFAIGLVVVASCHISYQLGKCPETDGPTSIYYIDPTNCKRFYECNDGYPLLFVCPRNTVFDSQLKICAYSPDGECLPEGPRLSKGGTTVRARLDKMRLGDSCPPKDEGWTTFVADVHNCSRYFECSKGSTILRYCPRGMEFNAKLLVCDFSHKAGCTPVLEDAATHRDASVLVREVDSIGAPNLAIECPKEAGNWPTYVIDPMDCSRFYECSTGRPVLLQCNEGLVFDSLTGSCYRMENVDCSSNSQKTLNILTY